jgi:hypothetical protein
MEGWTGRNSLNAKENFLSLVIANFGVSSRPGIAVRRTASLPLAYARPIDVLKDSGESTNPRGLVTATSLHRQS